jgi:hypothetical protein
LVKKQDFMIDGERSGSLPGDPRFPGDVKVLIKMAALPKGELLVKTSVPIQDLEFNDVFSAKFMRALAAPGHQRGSWRFPAILVHECS